MSFIHKNLAGGHFSQMSLCEQMANIGSEVERALNWKEKNNTDYSQKALERALDLIGITMAGTTDLNRLKEFTRTREALNDFFRGDNEYHSTNASWKKYFSHFTSAARRFN